MARFLRLGGLGRLVVMLTLGTAATAENEDAERTTFRLYGHFSPAVISYDDGENRYSNFADNSYSGGRIGFWLEFPVRRGRTRFNFETSLGLRQSASMSQFTVPPLIDLDATTLRKLEVIFDTNRLGSFSFGQGNMASDAVTESDLSGTPLAAYVGLKDTAGGYFFRTSAGTISSIRIQDAFPTFDGGRAPRLRWDSPDLSLDKLGSIRVAAAVGIEVSDGSLVLNDSLADAGLFYRNRVGAFELKGSFGVSLADVDGEEKPQSAGSISILHAASGVSFSVAVGARESGGEYQYSKFGLKRRWIDWGDTAVSFDYYLGLDTVNDGSRSESYGLGIVQDLDRSNLQLYLGLRRYELTTSGFVDHRPATSVLFGTRWVFKKLDNVRLRRGRTEVDWTESN